MFYPLQYWIFLVSRPWFTLSSVTQDHIFHIHVRLDIWRCRATRIHVRLDVSHTKETNSNGHQVYLDFWRTQWECILFICYEGSGVHLPPNITYPPENTWLPSPVHLVSLHVVLFDVSKHKPQNEVCNRKVFSWIPIKIQSSHLVTIQIIWIFIGFLLKWDPKPKLRPT